MMDDPLLVLASNSPRRRELIALGGWSFEVHPADVNEDIQPGETPQDYVLRLAGEKANACAAQAPRNALIVAADTTVVNGQAILGKPHTPAEAVEMLRSLRGHIHKVYSGLAVLRRFDDSQVTDLCITEVPMRSYTDLEIAAYIESGDPLDKAGAYGIQNAQFHPVDGLRGCYASVMGMPLCHLTRSLDKLGVVPLTDIARECQQALRYTCPVFAAVFRGEMVG